MKAIQIPSQLVGVTPLADGSMSLRFHTRECPAQEKLIMLEYFQKAGWLLFKDDEYNETDIPDEPSGYEEGKTPAQRQRAVLFIFWKEYKATEEPDFENFYRKHINRNIEDIKAKLP